MVKHRFETARKALPAPLKRWLRERFLPNTAWPFMDYPANPKYDFLYCWIPKVGCTSLKHWFLQTLGVCLPTDKDIHIFADENYSLATSRPATARRNLRGYFRFAVVRNPWERIVSAYIDKFVREPFNMQKADVMESIRHQSGLPVEKSAVRIWTTMNLKIDIPIDPRIDYDQGISFREFVEFLLASPDSNLDVHWKPQYSFLGGLSFDEVLKLENIDEDLPRMENRLGIPNRGIPHLHRSGSAAERVEAFNQNLSDAPSGTLSENFPQVTPIQLLTPELTRAIGERYSRDAAMFHYTIPNWVGE